MKFRKKIKITSINYSIIILILLSILFLSIESRYNSINNRETNESPTPAQSQFSEGSLTVDQNFLLIETSENTTTLNNINSVDINLGTSRWNVTNIKINVTDMYFKNETKVIEDKIVSTAFETISRYLHCIGVQIEILVPTIIYGVYIYGQNRTDPTAFKNTYLQIQGNNKTTGNPNGTILRSVQLNMSISNGLGWHMHKCPPLSLNKGFYYLVINGTTIGTSDKIKYDWFYNDLNPYYPYLNSSLYTKETLEWSLGAPGAPYLYKLVQRINQSFYPEEINLTAEINGKYHPIQNGNKISTGNLTVSFTNFFPNAKILQIPVKSNVSNAVFFNSSYYVKLNNSLICSGSVEIKDGLENKWTIFPNLERFGWNYSVSYKHSKSWEIIDVFKDDIKLTGNNYTNNQNTLIILNYTIPVTPMSWKITANSSNFDITLYFSKLEYKLGEDFGFYVTSPVKLGNYTFVLFDPLGNEYKETKTSISQLTFSFNYTIPSYAVSGEWIVFVFWNNITDAGVEMQTVLISGSQIITTPIIAPDSDDDSNEKTEDTGLDPFIIILTVLITLISTILGILSYQIVKKVKKINAQRKQRIIDKFLDILNLSYIIIAEKNTGINVYQQEIISNKIDAALISGFLEAIRTFGIELSGSQDQSQTIKLDFQSMKIIMSDFKNFRIINIMKENPSREFFEALVPLSYDIEKYYGKSLKDFSGEISQFEGIKDLIEIHLQISLIYPLSIVIDENTKLNLTEKTLVNKASKIMKQKSINYFFVSNLLSEDIFNVKTGETILKLINKGIFRPIKV